MRNTNIWIWAAGLTLCLFSLACEKNDAAILEARVVDQAGQPVKGAEVTLYATRLDWAGYDQPASQTAVTDQDGIAVVEAISNGRFFVNISAGNQHNRFGKIRTELPLETGRRIKETFAVRPPTAWEEILSGGANKRWSLAPLMTPDGQPFLDYPVDTDMYIDGRWYDSNGRLGLWWFSADETRIFYDYATSGAVVSSKMISLTETLFRAEIDFFGIRMLIEMYPA